MAPGPRDAQAGVGRRTRDTYTSYLHTHVIKTRGDRHVHTIAESEALKTAVLATRSPDGSPRSPRAAREVLRLARAVLLDAVRRKLIEVASGPTVTIERTTADTNPQRREAWRSYRGLVSLIVHAGRRIFGARGLRHALAARLIAASGTAKGPRAALGHHSAALALDRSGHLLDAHEEKARKRMTV